MSRRGAARRFATVLFTDIVGSTDIARELGDERWRELVRRHHAIVRRELKRFDGHEVDTAGDGFFAIFDSPGAAIRCAVAITDAVREVGLEVRAGLHGGEVISSEGKAGGIAVNTAARVMAVAGFGEVLVSGSLRDVVAGSALGFEDHGVHTLKGIEGEWHLYRVAIVDGERVAEPLDGAEASRRRLAVEPRREPRPGSRRLALVGGGVLLAGLTVLVAALMMGGEDRAPREEPLLPAPAGPPPESIVRVDARSGDVEFVRSDLPGTGASGVHDIEVGGGSVWITRIPLIVKIDPEDGSNVAVHGLEGDYVSAIGFGLARAWVAGTLLYAVDPGTGRAGEGMPYLENEPTFLTTSDVTAAFGRVWISSNDGAVTRVDPGTGTSTRIEVGDAPSRLVAGTDALWILDSNVVWRIDPRTNAVEAIPVSGRLDEVAVGGGFVWVLDSDVGTLFPISETDPSVRPGVDVGPDATDVAAGLGSIWVGSGGDILEIDTTTARIVRTIEIGETPIAGLAVDEEAGALWLDMAPVR